MKGRWFFGHLEWVSRVVACMAARDRYNPQRFRIPFSAEVAKSVDAVDSKSTVEIRAGSSPAFGTKNDYDNRETYNNQYVVQ